MRTTDSHTHLTAERLIRLACRILPADVRDEHCEEWTAELPAILADPNVRSPLRRRMNTLQYAAGTVAAARRSSYLSINAIAWDSLAQLVHEVARTNGFDGTPVAGIREHRWETRSLAIYLLHRLARQMEPDSSPSLRGRLSHLIVVLHLSRDQRRIIEQATTVVVAEILGSRS